MDLVLAFALCALAADTYEIPPEYLPYYIPLWFVGFVTLWCVMALVFAHVGGWARLAKRYRAQQRPAGKTFRFQSGKFGGVNYSGVFTVVVAREGMYLSVMPFFRLGHPPILLPWEAMENFEKKRTLFWTLGYVEIATEPRTKILLPLKLFEARLELDTAEDGH